MANTPASYQRAHSEFHRRSGGMRAGTRDNQRTARTLASAGVGPVERAEFVDETEKKLKDLEEELGNEEAELREAEQTLVRVRDDLSEKKCEAYELDAAGKAEILDVIKAGLAIPAVLEDLRRDVPDLPVPASMMTVLEVAEAAEEEMKKRKPELEALATQIADTHRGLKHLKKRVREDAGWREKATASGKAGDEAAMKTSELQVQVEELKAQVQKVDVALAAAEAKIEAERLTWQKKSSELEESLQVERKDKKELGDFNLTLNREVDKVSAKLKAMKESVEDVETRNINLMGDCLASDRKCEDLGKKIMQKEAALEAAETRAKDAEAKAEDARKENIGHVRAYWESEGKCNNLEVEMKRNESLLDQSLQQVGRLNRDIISLEAAIEEKDKALEQSRQETASLRGRVVSLQDEVKGQDLALKQSHQDLDSLKEASDGLQKEVEEQELALKQSYQDLEILRETSGSLRNEKKEKELALKQSYQELDRFRETSIRLQDELKEKEVALKQSHQEVESLRATTARSEGEMKEREAALKLSSQELVSLKETVAKLQEEMKDNGVALELARQDVNGSRGTAARLQAEVEEKEIAIGLLRYEVHSLKASVVDLQEEVKGKNVAQRATAEELQEAMSLADERLAAMQCLGGQKRQLVEQGGADRAKIRKLEAQLTTSEGDLTAFRFGVSRLLKAKESLKQDLGESLSTSEMLVVSENALRHRFEDSQESLRESREECKVLLDSLDSARSKVNSLEGSAKSLGQHLMASWGKVMELQVERSAMSDGLNQKDTKIKGLELSEASLQEEVRRQAAEISALKRQMGATTACFEQFLYEGLGQVSLQSWASGCPDLDLVLKDARDMGSVSSQASVWLATIPGLAEASSGGSARERAFQLFIRGHQLRAEVSLGDVYGVAECLGSESSPALTLALVLGFVRGVLARTVAAQASFSVARALILLRCVELLYLHVGNSDMSEAIRGVFAQMKQSLWSASQESCLVAGLVKWLSRTLKGQSTMLLGRWVLVKALERHESVKAAGADLVRQGDCLIVIKNFEIGRTSIAFYWPSGFRVEVSMSIDFIAGEIAECVPLEKSKEVTRLFADAIRRIFAAPGRGREGFVDEWQ